MAQRKPTEETISIAEDTKHIKARVNELRRLADKMNDYAEAIDYIASLNGKLAVRFINDRDYFDLHRLEAKDQEAITTMIAQFLNRRVVEIVGELSKKGKDL